MAIDDAKKYFLRSAMLSLATAYVLHKLTPYKAKKPLVRTTTDAPVAPIRRRRVVK